MIDRGAAAGFARDAAAVAGRFFFPTVCLRCDATIEQGALCAACEALLTGSCHEAVCPRCAGRVGPYAADADGCSLCRDDSFGFEKVVALGAYDGPLGEACRAAKSVAGRWLARALADLLCDRRGEALAAIGASLVVPAPNHWTKRLWRGGDHAETLAEQVGRRLGVPVDYRALRRSRRTADQANLSPTNRRRNVANAFTCRRRLAGAVVILVDDILTTGATSSHAARALRTAGAKAVYSAVVARGDARPGRPVG